MQYQKPISPKYLLIIIFLLLGGMKVTAQDETPKKITIGDHIFTPISYSPLPSTNTYINTLAGFGQTISEGDIINQEVTYLAKNGEKIPVVPFTAGTNIGGLCIPERGGILLDLKRMNRIIRIKE